MFEELLIHLAEGLDIDRFDEIISLSQDLGLNPLPQDPLKFASETMVLPTQEKTTGIRVDFIFSFTPTSGLSNYPLPWKVQTY